MFIEGRFGVNIFIERRFDANIFWHVEERAQHMDDYLRRLRP